MLILLAHPSAASGSPFPSPSRGGGGGEDGADSVLSGRPLAGDVLLPPVLPGKSAGGRSAGGAGFWDGSEYMLGRVGVALILVESDGSAEPSTEDWTEAETNRVYAEVLRATEWWAARAPGGRLSFTVELFPGVPVPCEPIHHPQSEEAVWIRPALQSLGWTEGDRFTATQRMVNDMKERLDLDWAFAVYVVDSSEDEDGMFADGVFFAYAYLGGPFLVLTLDNDGWGVENFAAVCAHEMGHIFYALDQYASARVPCDRASGYLARRTANSEYGDCPEEEPECIMRSRPLRNAALSVTATGQIGWDDTDGDGVPDVIDTEPEVEIEVEGEGGPLLSGVASVRPLANRNPYGYGHAVSINRIAAVEIRVDGGAWTAALPADGAWDGPEEAFTFSLGALAGEGTHRVEARARNTAGNLSPAAAAGWTSPGGAGEPASQVDAPPALAVLGNRPNPFNPSTRILFRAPAAGPLEAAVYDTRGILIRILSAGDAVSGENLLEWDGRDRRGREAPSGRYFCRIRTGGESVVHPMLLLR